MVGLNPIELEPPTNEERKALKRFFKKHYFPWVLDSEVFDPILIERGEQPRCFEKDPKYRCMWVKEDQSWFLTTILSKEMLEKEDSPKRKVVLHLSMAFGSFPLSRSFYPEEIGWDFAENIAEIVFRGTPLCRVGTTRLVFHWSVQLNAARKRLKV